MFLTTKHIKNILTTIFNTKGQRAFNCSPANITERIIIFHDKSFTTEVTITFSYGSRSADYKLDTTLCTETIF